ncbi:MAG: SufD family Fe-S cluster assembly protein [Candidatus Rhabdochlamydia sp.]
MFTSEPTLFSRSLEKMASCLKSPLQIKAWESITATGLPHKTSDSFKSFPFRKLYETAVVLRQDIPTIEDILPYVIPEAKNSYLVFVNGAFLPQCSKIPAALEVMTLGEGLKRYAFFLQGKISKWIKEEKDPFALLNFALYQEGAFLYLPAQQVLKEPVQIIHFGQDLASYHPSLLYFFGASASQIHLVSTAVGEGVYHPVFDASLEEEAVVSYTENALEARGVILSDVRAYIKRKAQFNYWNVTRTTTVARSHLNISLLAEEAEANLQGVWSLQDHQQSHVCVDMKHLAPFTKSLQRFKGVLKDSSLSSFEGKIHVDSKAQKTEAYQVNHNLLLSPGAIAHARPNLTIFADDVKASHGATIAQIDEESLFYLQSRGISIDKGKELLVKSFIREVLDVIPYVDVSDDFFI